MADKSLQEKVAETLASISPKIEAAVIEAIVGREVEKKSKILVQGLDTLQALERDFKRLERPDVEAYGEDEKMSASFYSKTRIEERKKGREKILKLKGAIEKALTKGDYGDLNNLANTKPGQPEKDNPGETA